MLGMKEESIRSESQSSEKSFEGLVTVRIMGNLGKTSGGQKVETEIVNPPIKLESAIRILKEKYDLDLRRDNTLVIINGVEARALDDLETILVAGDDVVFVPMIHGG